MNFAIEVCRANLDVGEGSGDGSEVRRPVIAMSGQHANLAAFDPGAGAVAVELDLMDPCVALRRALHQRGEFGGDEVREGSGWAAGHSRVG